jgi:PAS domain S-box-containing protein
MVHISQKILSKNNDPLQNLIPTRITIEQFHILLDNVQIMVVIMDAKGRVIYCNHYFQTILEITPQEIVAKDWFAISMIKGNRGEKNLRISDFINNNEIISSFTQEYISQDNISRTIAWKNTAIWNVQGEIEFVVCFGEDITERKKNESERLQLLETLEKHVADRTIELEALYTVATIANEVLELPMMLEKMLVQTLQAIGVPYGAIHLLDTDEDELHLVTHVGIPSEIVKRISSITTGFGLTGWVAQQKHPLTLMNVSDDPRILTIGQVSGYSLYLSAPLLSQNHLLGVISIFGDSSQQLNPERIALLTTIADQIGTAVERAQLRGQAEQTVILEERQRVARELHDSVTQSLYSLTLLAAAGQRSAQDGSQERTLRNLDSISMIAFQTLKEMRLLVYELQPSTLGSGGLAEAIQRRLDSVEEHSGMQTKFIIENEIDIPKPVEIELFGLAQEALNNSIKHGAATSVAVQLAERDGFIILEICDNGKGFDTKLAENKHGTGLISMNERVNNLGGHIKMTSAPGEGTCIQAIIPINFDKTMPRLTNMEETHG